MIASKLTYTDPVLLCNDLGAKQNASGLSAAEIEISGRSSMSVKEAVRIAQSNNFMGLVCSSRLLVRPLSITETRPTY